MYFHLFISTTLWIYLGATLWCRYRVPLPKVFRSVPVHTQDIRSFMFVMLPIGNQDSLVENFYTSERVQARCASTLTSLIEV